jgi:hypothetical protein
MNDALAAILLVGATLVTTLIGTWVFQDKILENNSSGTNGHAISYPTRMR